MAKRRIPIEVRKLVFERDHATCQWKDCGLSRDNGDVINLHHILPEQFGGDESPDNLITLCDIHHKRMHIEFSAFYSDSQGVLTKMNHLTRHFISRFRRVFKVDDGYDLTSLLVYLTGRSEFRDGQLKTVRAALAGESVLFVTPTGSGKSVTYQLPGLLGKEASLVVSPLKALMKDQVESIWSKKIPTTYINSDLGKEETKRRYAFIRRKLYKFIFVAPERFESRGIDVNALYGSYSHLVVDEAHSIDTWGIAFRPSYRKLGNVRKKLGNPPVIALTATASKSTQQHILESLNIPDARVIVTGFKKDNIRILTHKIETVVGGDIVDIEKGAYIARLIREHQGEKILVFTPTIKHGDKLLKNLRDRGVEVEFYHSKLDVKRKMEIQNRFTGIEKPGLSVLISTSAFGMGIDIPDIRHVVHLSPALSVTDYVQQIGRAGRDGEQSYAHLLYAPEDKGLLEFMAERSTLASDFKEKHNYTDSDVERVRARLKEQVQQMLLILSQEPGTEWDYILDYFGETPPSYWESNGKRIIDRLMVAFTLIVVVSILLLLTIVFI